MVLGGDRTRTENRMDLKRYNLTVLRFDPKPATAIGETFVLPVESPDEEHAISAALSNAVAFTTKSEGKTLLPLAFQCLRIGERD